MVIMVVMVVVMIVVTIIVMVEVIIMVMVVVIVEVNKMCKIGFDYKSKRRQCLYNIYIQLYNQSK